jgi:ATP-dependent DNA ligase
MHPTEISRPIHHAGWVYEEKVDGWRMVATKAEGSVRLVSRNGHTRRFPEVVTALAALKPATFTLDGEVAVYDAELVSHFEWLRHLNHGALSTPPMFMAKDPESPYIGGRTLKWLKVKQKDYRKEARGF